MGALAPACVWASGCVSLTLLGAPPPPLETALVALESEPPCVAVTAIEDLKAAAPPDPSAEVQPSVIERCAPVYPQVLVDAGVTGACVSMIDVDDEGSVVSVGSRCNVFVPRSPFEEEWARFAASLFVASADRSVAHYRVSPADPLRPDEQRTGLEATVFFGIRDSFLMFTWDSGVPIPQRPASESSDAS